MTEFRRIYWSPSFNWKAYAKAYDEYCRTNGNYYASSSKLLIGPAQLKDRMTVLDAGCGTGVMSEEIINRIPSAKIYAVDLSEEMLKFYKSKFGRQIAQGQVNAFEGDVENLSAYTIPQSDVVFLASCIWDMDLQALFSHLQCIKKGGLVITNVPVYITGCEDGFIGFIESNFRKEENVDRAYRRIKLEELKAAANENGFAIERTEPYEFNLSASNIGKFFRLLKYRYPFVFFSDAMSYEGRLKRCETIFNRMLKKVPEEGIDEKGDIFLIRKV